ncbi:histidine phosphotransferase family protein [Palleronia marisminoris]|nr:histidine phosphotransferase family protein [Palleronia marisminoris]
MNALLGSRICHDLISPLGAICNGVELVEMMGSAGSAEIALLSDSAAAANARIRLFRIAFGMAAPGQKIGWGELGSVVDTLSAGRMKIDWAPASDLDRVEAKLGVLLVLCAETLIPFGGTVRVEMGPRITLEIAAERMRDAPELLQQLIDDTAELPAPSELHFPLARVAAAELGRRIDLNVAEGQLRITA